MEYEIPLSLEMQLQDMGVMSSEHEELDDPTKDKIREVKFRRPKFDENGEPEVLMQNYLKNIGIGLSITWNAIWGVGAGIKPSVLYSMKCI